MLRRLVALSTMAMWLVAPAAAAGEITAAELPELARRAIDDPTALTRLRAVDQIDGRRVPMSQILDGSIEEVEARLHALARDGATPATDAAADRADAKRVLAQERFQPERVPRPLRGVLTWLGDNVVQPVGDRLAAVFDGIAGVVPGGRPVAWLIVGVLVGIAAWAVARRWTRARLEPTRGTRRAGEVSAPNPDRLEREADEAERAGDLESAIRLRFRAGLLRLDERDVIEFRPSITSHEVAMLVRSSNFDALAKSFDEIVYGRRPAEPEDVATARRTWPAVVARPR